MAFGLDKSSNPMFKDDVIDSFEGQYTEKMTVSGTIQKTLLLTLIMITTAAFSWQYMIQLSNLKVILFGSVLVGAGMAFFAMKKPDYAKYLAPFYAITQGLFLGVVSVAFESLMDGIIMKAGILTLSTLFLMLILFQSGAIKVTDKFRSIIMGATGAIMLFYLVAMVLGMFGVDIPMLHEGSAIGIGFSVVVVVLAALNLLLDFDYIEKQTNRGAPKKYEWVGALGLMVTIVWLYLEFLRLLSKLND